MLCGLPRVLNYEGGPSHRPPTPARCSEADAWVPMAAKASHPTLPLKTPLHQQPRRATLGRDYPLLTAWKPRRAAISPPLGGC